MKVPSLLPSMIRNLQSDSNDEALETAAVQPALKKPRLTDQEMEEIIMGGRLSDAHINRAQKILKSPVFLH